MALPSCPGKGSVKADSLTGCLEVNLEKAGTIRAVCFDNQRLEFVNHL